MVLNPTKISPRDRLILAGLFLSKFDGPGLDALGFDTFTEAFNTLGYGLGGRPASIKNYRDEFDPLFPNPRQGWKNRPIRQYCAKVETEYRTLSLSNFSTLLMELSGTPADSRAAIPEPPDKTTPTSFAKRLITGRAAEHYFQTVLPGLPQFSHCEMEDTTAHGCGYDFRLWPQSGDPFIAVEVKGMLEQRGTVSLTEKEHHSAAALQHRFHLFVVKNFREKPFHEIHPDPLSGPLIFTRIERPVIQISWSASA